MKISQHFATRHSTPKSSLDEKCLFACSKISFVFIRRLRLTRASSALRQADNKKTTKVNMNGLFLNITSSTANGRTTAVWKPRYHARRTAPPTTARKTWGGNRQCRVGGVKPPPIVLDRTVQAGQIHDAGYRYSRAIYVRLVYRTVHLPLGPTTKASKLTAGRSPTISMLYSRRSTERMVFTYRITPGAKQVEGGEEGKRGITVSSQDTKGICKRQCDIHTVHCSRGNDIRAVDLTGIGFTETRSEALTCQY